MIILYKKRQRLHKNPLLVAISALTVGCLFAAASLAAAIPQTTYGKSYTMENILSDFQYFIKGDLTSTNHCVGAAASGGTVTLGAFGDAAVTPSYFGTVASVGNYNGGSFFAGTPYAGYVGLYPAYYKNKASANASTSNLTAYAGGTDYIDFTQAFQALSQESAAFATASDAQAVTTADVSSTSWSGSTLNLELSNTKDWNIVIPESIYNSINYINITGITINDLTTHRYMISVPGLNQISFTFSYIDLNTSSSTGTKGIELNGNSFNNNNSLKNITGSVDGGQLNTTGMKLVWNFPDATAVTTDYTAGHIIAPKAAVTIKSGTGNFEGSVIASSLVDSSAEAHFFPYNSIPTVPAANSSSSSSSSGSSQSGSSGGTSSGGSSGSSQSGSSGGSSSSGSSGSSQSSSSGGSSSSGSSGSSQSSSSGGSSSSGSSGSSQSSSSNTSSSNPFGHVSSSSGIHGTYSSSISSSDGIADLSDDHTSAVSETAAGSNASISNPGTGMESSSHSVVTILSAAVLAGAAILAIGKRRK